MDLKNGSIIDSANSSDVSFTHLTSGHATVVCILSVIICASFCLLFTFALHNFVRYLILNLDWENSGQSNHPAQALIVWIFYVLVLSLTIVAAALFGHLANKPNSCFVYFIEDSVGQNWFGVSLQVGQEILSFSFFCTVTLMMHHLKLALQLLQGTPESQVDKWKLIALVSTLTVITLKIFSDLFFVIVDQ